MDYSDIIDVTHEHGEIGVRKLLEKGWVILAVGPGQDEERAAYMLYSLGKKRDKQDSPA